MHVFGWIEDLCRQLDDAGQRALAGKIWHFDEHCRETRKEIADAVYPELLGAAKSLGLPWLEIYARHFHLVMRRRLGEAETLVGEAVRLFEPAHRDEHKDCPQSICATQDLIICYSRMDAPGYLEECRQAVVETLAKIDPSWNCFHCLTTDWSRILCDVGKHEEAAAYLAEQHRVTLAAGETLPAFALIERANAASLCGRHDEARASMHEAALADPEPSERDAQRRETQRAWIEARAGRLGEAARVLPPFDEALGVSHFRHWSEAIERLIEGGARANDRAVGAAFDTMMRHLERGGAHDQGMVIAEIHARLSAGRAAFWTAGRAQAAFERMRARLRDPARALERSRRLADAMAATPLPPVPAPSDRLLTYLRELPEGHADADPERAIPWLLTAGAERPEDADLHLTAASVMAGRAALAEAEAIVAAFVTRVPTAENAWLRLHDLRLERNDTAGVERLIADCAPHVPMAALFARARLALRQERYVDCIAAAEQMLATMPDASAVRRMLATAARHQQDHALAAQHLAILVAGNEEPGSDDWDLLISATVLRDGARVKQCCERLQLPVAPETMPALWEGGGTAPCLIIYRNAQGRAISEWAERIGPVSARITEVEGPNLEQRYRDLVVFDARPLTPRPEDPEKAKSWVADYRHVHTEERGNYRSWLVDGADPGREPWSEFRARLRERQWEAWRHSGDDYQVADPESGKEDLPGVYGYVAAPDGTPPAAIAAALTELTRDWAHPLCWLDLAKAAQHEVDRHQAIKQRYKL